MRYDLIPGEFSGLLDAVMRYKDGREVCCDTPAGKTEYGLRTAAMVERQDKRCPLCLKFLSVSAATFEHEAGRGMGAAHRDDRIVDASGNPINAAVHGNCNTEKGSKRLHYGDR